MYCKFMTNIDCCKVYMRSISGLDISPLVGDLVTIYRDSGLLLILKVVGKTWHITDCNDLHIVCDLHLPPWIESIAHLERILRE